jgi:hypothetical protein
MGSYTFPITYIRKSVIFHRYPSIYHRILTQASDQFIYFIIKNIKCYTRHKSCPYASRFHMRLGPLRDARSYLPVDGFQAIKRC